MFKSVFSNSLLALSFAVIAVGCAKANYYEKDPHVLNKLSADNDLVMTEGEKKDLTVKLVTGGEEDEIVQWRIKSDKYPVRARFKTPEGVTPLNRGQNELQITIFPADVDQVQQGDQVFELELETADGKKTVVPLTLLDVKVTSPEPVQDDEPIQVPVNKGKGPKNSHERVVELEVKDQGTQPLVKVLLVIDNSFSMKLKQTQLADGIRSIAKSLSGKNLQFFLYTTSNDHDDDGRFDKRTVETVKGKRSLHAPYQDADLMIQAGMPAEAFERAVSDLQRNIMNLGHVGSKNESALCTLNNILREQDVKKQILKKGDDALVFILSDTDDHSRDVPVKDCGGVVSPRKIIASLDGLLGRKHYGITAVISNAQANKGHTCGDLILDEGKQYTALVKASPTPDRIFSICAKDYSEALDSVNVFSRQSIVNEFPLDLKAQESIGRIQLIRSGRMVALAPDQYELRGNTLRVSQKNLRVGDRLRVAIK